MATHFHTARFIVRDIVHGDAEGLFALDADVEVLRYIGTPPLTTMAQAHERIDHIRSQYECHGIGRWAIEDSASGEFIGWTGLKYETEIRTEPYIDLGYRLRPGFWGQGIATETALGSIKYGFETLGYELICAAAHNANAASRRILTKVGMQWQEYFEFEDIMCSWYTLSRAEWEEK